MIDETAGNLARPHIQGDLLREMQAAFPMIFGGPNL